LGETDFTVGFADQIFSIQCATFMELRLLQMGDFYEKPHVTIKNFKFWEPVKWGVEKYWTKVPKGTPLRQIWSNKSFGACGSSVGLTIYDGEKKYARIAIGKSMSSKHYGRYRDVVIVARAAR